MTCDFAVYCTNYEMDEVRTNELYEGLTMRGERIISPSEALAIAFVYFSFPSMNSTLNIFQRFYSSVFFSLLPASTPLPENSLSLSSGSNNAAAQFHRQDIFCAYD